MWPRGPACTQYRGTGRPAARGPSRSQPYPKANSPLPLPLGQACPTPTWALLDPQPGLPCPPPPASAKTPASAREGAPPRFLGILAASATATVLYLAWETRAPIVPPGQVSNPPSQRQTEARAEADGQLEGRGGRPLESFSQHPHPPHERLLQEALDPPHTLSHSLGQFWAWAGCGWPHGRGRHRGKQRLGLGLTPQGG